MAGAQVSTRLLVPARTARREEQRIHREKFRGARLRKDVEPLRRRGVGQMLDAAVEVLVARFGACVGIAALCWLPFLIATEVVMRSGAPQEIVLLASLIRVVPQVLTTSFVCSIVGGYVLGEDVSLGRSVGQGFRALPGVAIISGITFAAAIVLICACLVGTYLAYWLFAVAPAVYVLERERLRNPAEGRLAGWISSVLRAVGRGVRLVLGWGSFLRWLGWILVTIIMIFPLMSSPQTLEMPEIREFLQETLAIRGGPVEFLLAGVGAVFVGIGTAYTAIIMTVYYLDERVRKEGLDLELALQRLESVHPEATA